MKAFKVGDKLKIQICDGPDGCGNIIAGKRYSVPQRCQWQNHTHQKRYAGKQENAPTRRVLVVQVVK